MNRSFSKIRHIQEANIRLEKRILNEDTQSTTGTTINSTNTESNNINDLISNIVNTNSGVYFPTDKPNLTDEQKKQNAEKIKKINDKMNQEALNPIECSGKCVRDMNYFYKNNKVLRIEFKNPYDVLVVIGGRTEMTVDQKGNIVVTDYKRELPYKTFRVKKEDLIAMLTPSSN